MAADYKGLTVNSWTGTWSPSGDHPIVLNNEMRGGIHSITGNAGDQLSDISGQRLQEGMLVYISTEDKWYTYKLQSGESRSTIDGTMPNNAANWSEYLSAETLTSLTFNATTGNLEYTDETGATNSLDLSSLNVAETNTTLSFSGDTLTYTDETGTSTDIDLSKYLDEDARAISSGVLNSTTGIVTFTRDDTSEFELDLSDLLDDTNLVTSVAGKAGVVTLVKADITDFSESDYEPADSTILKDADIGSTIQAYDADTVIDANYAHISVTTTTVSDGTTTLTLPTDFDPAGTDNSTDVTLNTTNYDYLSITDQQITLNQIDYATDISGAPANTDDISEGTTNLYFTDARAQDAVANTATTFSSITLGDATLSWNATDGTVDIAYPTATLQTGQEQHFYAKATGNILNGQLVMFAGSEGEHVLVQVCDPSAVGFEPQWVMGVATQDFVNNQFGYVTTFGKVRELDTTAFNDADILYMDPTIPGALTSTRPSPDDHIIQVAAVLRSHSQQGTLLVRLTHRPDTNEVPEGSTNLYYTDDRVNTYLGSGSAGNIITTGYIAGPEFFTIDPAAVGDATGTVIIAGNLQVDGTTTTINSTTVNVSDLNVQLATDSTNKEAANGAGITVDLGSDGNAFINYDSTNDRWTTNKNIATDLVGNASTATTWETARSISLTGAVTGTVSGVDGSGNISIATTATSDPTLTLTGDATGSATFTNLGNATLTVTVTDNSHEHDDKQNKMIISDTAPSTDIIDSDQWWDSAEGILKVRFNNQWVESATSLASIPQGPGSGLNADLLDGLDSGAFIRSNANDTATGIITFTNTTDSTSSTTGAVRLNGGLGVAKNIYAGADVFAYSDERLKENIELIPDAIGKVTALRGVTFNRKEDDSRSTGVIAQDVQQVLPEAVHEDEAGMLSVKYGNMVGLLIEAMKEQQAQIDALKTEIQQLRGDK